MHKNYAFFSVLILVLAMVATANAAITANFTNSGVENVTGSVFNPITYLMEDIDVDLVHNVMTVNTDDEFFIARIYINLTQGSIVNIFFGDTEPPPSSPAHMFYDTYVATPDDYTYAQLMQYSIGSTSLLLEWDVPQKELDGNGNLVDIPAYRPGIGVDQMIASISLSPDAMGTITGYTADMDLALQAILVPFEFEYGIIALGRIIPEPFTMTLMCIGGLGVLLRKRR